MLANEISDLHADEFDMALLGFDADEFDRLMQIVPDFAPGTEDDQGQLDEKAKVTCPECKHEFTP